MTDAWDGFPPNPERCDHYWLLHPNGQHVFVDRWMRAPKEWFNAGPPEVASLCTYLGPCLLPAEVEARVAAARREALEAAARVASNWNIPSVDLPAAIRALLEENSHD